MRESRNIKVAIIDLNNGKVNQGLSSLLSILEEYSLQHSVIFLTSTFELRNKGEIPNLNFDIYISTGGPGSPYEGYGHKWESDFFTLLSDLDTYNAANDTKKFCFLICHSFQLACLKYKLGAITRREKTASGVFPIHLTTSGLNEPTFKGLDEVFYSVDSRNWQVVKPNEKKFKEKNAILLAIETEYPSKEVERCMMAIRFSNEMIGTQFHPEAQPDGIKYYLEKPEIKKLIVENYGLSVHENMLQNLNDIDKIPKTLKTILPNFLTNSIKTLFQ